ncbi:MAG: hypothetical protein H7039_03420 [Bryobacteraceae bacterium]|nr:hypothetical protein [Bryobacteraceae bacterium]
MFRVLSWDISSFPYVHNGSGSLISSVADFLSLVYTLSLRAVRSRLYLHAQAVSVAPNPTQITMLTLW